jgi:hypothetical protein
MTTPPEPEHRGRLPASEQRDPEKFQPPAPLPMPRRRPAGAVLLDPEPRWLRAMEPPPDSL